MKKTLFWQTFCKL